MRLRGGGSWPPLDGIVVQFGEAYPGGDVSFVVERGDDKFGAGRDIENEGEVREELGCRGADDCSVETLSVAMGSKPIGD